jgi:FKBP-type peptidyl-prolyl cis-trans isomerase SlpA
MTLPRQRFAAALNLEPGLVVDFAATAGSLPGVIKAVEGDRVLVDFNHPLAGRTLVFAVAIRAVAEEAGS